MYLLQTDRLLPSSAEAWHVHFDLLTAIFSPLLVHRYSSKHARIASGRIKCSIARPSAPHHIIPTWCLFILNCSSHLDALLGSITSQYSHDANRFTEATALTCTTYHRIQLAQPRTRNAIVFPFSHRLKSSEDGAADGSRGGSSGSYFIPVLDLMVSCLRIEI